MGWKFFLAQIRKKALKEEGAGLYYWHPRRKHPAAWPMGAESEDTLFLIVKIIRNDLEKNK